MDGGETSSCVLPAQRYESDNKEKNADIVTNNHMIKRVVLVIVILCEVLLIDTLLEKTKNIAEAIEIYNTIVMMVITTLL